MSSNEEKRQGIGEVDEKKGGKERTWRKHVKQTSRKEINEVRTWRKHVKQLKRKHVNKERTWRKHVNKERTCKKHMNQTRMKHIYQPLQNPHSHTHLLGRAYGFPRPTLPASPSSIRDQPSLGRPPFPVPTSSSFWMLLKMLGAHRLRMGVYRGWGNRD